MEKTIVCLKWGQGVYSPEWVNRLYRGVKRHLSSPFRFVCFTDEPAGMEAGIEARDIQTLTFAPSLSGIWWKLAVLHPDAQLSGDCLFLDLDTVIVGDMDDFFTVSGRFCIIHNWLERRKQIFRRRPAIGNSSVFRFIAGNEPHVAELFMQDPAAAQDKNRFRTEQAFMTAAVGLDNITWWPEPWVRSYKRHCLKPFPLNCISAPALPADARIIAFHGTPKPPDVINGYRGALHKRSLPMPSLAAHWR